MGKTLNEVMSELPARRRRRIEARGAQLIEEEMTLRDLRKAMGKTQVQLARQLDKPQATISRMEAQSDMLISTLNEVVGAMGGRVRIVAELPGRRSVSLAGLGDLGGVRDGGAASRSAPDKPPRASKRRQPARAGSRSA